MAIVAAGVHSTFVLRGVDQSGLFLDWQRIHVCTQCDRLGSVSAEVSEYAGSSRQRINHVDSRSGQSIAHNAAGPEFLVAEFGVAVQIVAQLHEVGEFFGDEFPDSVDLIRMVIHTSSVAGSGVPRNEAVANRPVLFRD